MESNLITPELQKRVDADDPAALFEYAELVRETDQAEAYKFTVLSAQLGHPPAMERMGDDYLDDEDIATAAQYYKSGAKAGLINCNVKLAVLNLDVNERAAVLELEELAQMGVPSACTALADYYQARGNKKQSAYWRSVLN